MTRFDAVNIGIATQTDAGLMVPVVRHAEARDLWASAAEVARLADAARTGKATRDELSGSTITITSLGPLGGIVSTPVINAPEVAIVGVNRIVERPVVHDGRDRAAAIDEPLVVVRPPGDRRAARRGVRAGAARLSGVPGAAVCRIVLLAMARTMRMTMRERCKPLRAQSRSTHPDPAGVRFCAVGGTAAPGHGRPVATASPFPSSRPLGFKPTPGHRFFLLHGARDDV